MPLLDTDLSVLKTLFDVNVFAIITVTQAFAPLLIESKGTVINIGSGLGFVPFPWQGCYNATKAAVHLITDQMRLEFLPWGINTILVVTGSVKTKFFDNLADTPRLPQTSRYLPARDEIEPIMGGESDTADSAIDVDKYARAVVNNALKSKPQKHQWIGGSVWTVWLVTTFAWATFWVRENHYFLGPGNRHLLTPCRTLCFLV